MSQVMHTVDVQYGSYSEKDYKVTCDENDDNDFIKARVKRLLKLDFLPMATLSVKVTGTEYIDE